MRKGNSRCSIFTSKILWSDKWCLSYLEKMLFLIVILSLLPALTDSVRGSWQMVPFQALVWLYRNLNNAFLLSLKASPRAEPEDWEAENSLYFYVLKSHHFWGSVIISSYLSVFQVSNITLWKRKAWYTQVNIFVSTVSLCRESHLSMQALYFYTHIKCLHI